MAVVVFSTAGGCGILSNGKNPNDGGKSGSREDIPTTAKLVREGRDRLEWQATNDGRVYLFDARNRKLIYNTPVRRDQRLAVDVGRGQIQVDRRRSQELNMDRQATMELYFLADGASSDADTKDRQNSSPRPGDRRAAVPDTASVVTDAAAGRDLVYKAEADGKVYLYDVTRSRLVDVFNMQKGQSLAVSPGGKKAAVDEKVILSDMPLDRANKYRLLFDRSDARR